jgi:hypothetical protein
MWKWFELLDLLVMTFILDVLLQCDKILEKIRGWLKKRDGKHYRTDARANIEFFQ